MSKFQEVENDRSFLAYRRMAVVKLPDLGTLQGSVDQTAWTKRIFFTFTGIKFAESPRDNLRFKVSIKSKLNRKHFCNSEIHFNVSHLCQ